MPYKSSFADKSPSCRYRKKVVGAVDNTPVPTAPNPIKEEKAKTVTPSIANFSASKSENAPATTLLPTESKLNQTFSVVELKTAWQEYIKQCTSESIKALFQTALINLNGTNSVEITVKDEYAQTELQDKKIQILKYLKEFLKNDFIELKFAISKSEGADKEKPKTLYLPSEKLNSMVTKNPYLTDLRKRLDLHP